MATPPTSERKAVHQPPPPPPPRPAPAVPRPLPAPSPAIPAYMTPYYGGYYPISPPSIGLPPPEERRQTLMGIEAKKKKRTGLLGAWDELVENETKSPYYIKPIAYFGLGLLGGVFMPFYPWYMVLFIAVIVALVAHKFPNLGLILLILFVTAEVGYQSPEFGVVFLTLSLMILGASLFDPKFGLLTFYMVFLGQLGLSFAVPIFTVMIYSTFYGIAVGVVGGLMLVFCVTLANYKVFGLMIGPLTETSLTLINRHTQPLLDPLSSFTFSDFGNAYHNLTTMDINVLTTGLGNLGFGGGPLLQLILWAVAFYFVSYIVTEKAKISREKWLLYSGISGGILAATFIGAAAAYGILNAGTFVLGLGIIGVVYFVTAFSLIVQDIYSGYFTSLAGGTAVGSRIAEMTTLHKTTFEMVGGLADVKADIKESLIVPLLRRDVAEQFGIEPPKGIMLFGPPGCGKTLLMKALATELNVEMISVKCSDLMSKWYGESENRVAELFRTAKERRPCILFLDELDAIAKRRDLYSADDVSPRILTIILTEMDGMDKATGVIIVGTTNKPELVDPAIMRPGRFDKIIYVPPPDYDERIDILKVHLVGKPVGPDVDLAEIAKRTERFSGADLANLVKEAATITMKRSMQTSQLSLICMADFLQVLPNIKPSISLRMKEDYEKMKMDYERKMHQLQRAERKIIVRWDDVGGLEDVKRALREYVELPLTKPELIEEYKLKTGRGLMLFGPPGCGKTHIMRAASNELGIPIQIVNGPELVSALAGASEAAVRDVITRARENAPSIIFFDEIDALASKESMKTPEVTRAVSQFLTEMDGLKPKDKVIIVATTNRPHILDPALLRPGRFDKIFYVPPPDLQARKDIFEIHLRDVPKAGYIDTMLLAHRTEGYSGADIAAIIDEAKLIAIRERVKVEGPARRGPETMKLVQHLGSQKQFWGVKMEYLLEALSKTKSSITPETLEWAKKFLEIYGTR